MTTMIRWMIPRDFPDVVEIEQRSFASSQTWTEESFRLCLRARNTIGMVADDGESAVGFIVYELVQDKMVILNMAVHPSFRRQGIGRSMIDKLKRKLTPSRHCIIAEVRETNLTAQLFFQKQGFRAVGILGRHYEDTSEDAYQMQFMVDAAILQANEA